MWHLLLALNLFLLSCLSTTSFELCAHENGDAHLFFFGGSCAGEHADLHDSEQAHGHAHSGDASHAPHGNAPCEDTDGEHHEPCEHELLSFETEWLTRAAHYTSIDVPQVDLRNETDVLTSVYSLRQVAAVEAPPRAPPRRMASGYHFLATVRLLI
ncbi:MAG TPA: hypothetical protein VJ952_07145 [Opitutales bacterium]|nr:hypothetical protein [Opitutales bacterium]